MCIVHGTKHYQKKWRRYVRMKCKFPTYLADFVCPCAIPAFESALHSSDPTRPPIFGTSIQLVSWRFGALRFPPEIQKGVRLAPTSSNQQKWRPEQRNVPKTTNFGSAMASTPSRATTWSILNHNEMQACNRGVMEVLNNKTFHGACNPTCHPCTIKEFLTDTWKLNSFHVTAVRAM